MLNTGFRNRNFALPQDLYAVQRRTSLALASPGLLRDASFAQVVLDTGEQFRQY